jgi:wyosine [tRNA(Phe)-imidazoG37] synthetase (radical SAM superfamily)
MERDDASLAYGPVPSRRLGRSLGINNIPPKICSYSCIYCQLGRTDRMAVKRAEFFDPERVFNEVNEKVVSCSRTGDRIDYLTFVPDGEPTLDIDLGREIAQLKDLNIPVAVITNSSLLHLEAVRSDLMDADLISVKIDSVVEKTWKAIDRPHADLKLEAILSGIEELSSEFTGTLITETMLVNGINDGPEEIELVARYIAGIGPAMSYITVPIRPPSEKWVKPPVDATIKASLSIFSSHGLRTECLVDKEYGDFTNTGDAMGDILAITSVHPMRGDSLHRFLEKAGETWRIVDELLESGSITVQEFGGIRFFRRRFR